METTCEEFLQVTDHNRVSASSETNIQPVLRWPTQNVIEAEILNYNGSDEEILSYMHNNKVDCALKIFSSEKKITMPDYIERAISFDD